MNQKPNRSSLSSSSLSSSSPPTTTTENTTKKTTTIKQNNAQEQYHVPHGRLFQTVGCPHYLAEIIIYLSFFLLLRYGTPSNNHQHRTFGSYNDTYGYNTATVSSISCSSWFWWYYWHNSTFTVNKERAVLVWVVVNLMVSARSNHQWYCQRFGEMYPKERKILVPYLW